MKFTDLPPDVRVEPSLVGTAQILAILPNKELGPTYTDGVVRPKKKDKDIRKGKSRRYCLGGRIYSIPCVLVIYPRTILKKRMNSSFSFKSSWCNSSYSSNHPSAKTARAARNLINSAPSPHKQQRRPVPSHLSLSFFYE